MATSVVAAMKMGNIVPRVEIEPTSGILGQQATSAPCKLPDVTTLPTTPCTSLPERSRLLHYLCQAQS